MGAQNGPQSRLTDTHSLEGGLAEFPTARVQQGQPFPFLLLSFRGVAKAALYCAHRTIDMFLPSLLVLYLGMGAD
jgi:hypothetical protein